MMERCSNCDRPILVGDYYFTSIRTEGRYYCSEKCMKQHILDTMADEIVDDWIEANAEEYSMESSDPYARYGVNMGDFI